MISICEKWEKFSNVSLNIEEYNKLLNFLYENDNKLFNKKKLLPSINGEFNFLKNLSLEYNINQEIKKGVEEIAKLKFNEKLLNPKIKINNLNINIFSIDDLLNEINQYLNSKPFTQEKFEISQILIKFVPSLESNDMNDKIINEHKDIINIYFHINKMPLKYEILQTNFNSIWTSVDKYIMIDVQDKLQNRKSIDIKKEYEYIEFLNKYQKYFNFSKYNLIPNSYGELLKISELEDYNDIPEEILFEIKILFFKDLKKNSICNGINIEGIVKKSMYNIGEIIENCFKIKKKEEDSKFDYKNTYQICKVIIKYIPVNEDIKENQKRLYNLYKLFDKDIGDMIEINSSANLYNHVNKGIIQYINEQINNCSDITKTKNYIKDIFKFIIF